MSDAEFPALGFDPAYGNVSEVRRVAGELTGTGKYAGEAYEVLKAIQSKRDVWTGNAADKFADKLGELPGFLDDAHDSMTSAGKAMSTWSDQLEAHQRQARRLEEQAEAAIRAAERADAAAQEATARANTPIAYPPDDPGAAQAAQRQVQANAAAAEEANRAARAAWDKVEDIRRKAHDLQDRWEDDARVCREALSEASERAPASGLFDDIGDWVGNATEWLGDNLGDIAGIVSAIAGALAFIPCLTPIMGPIAIGAGAIALAAHGTEMVVEGKWDEPTAWVELGGDVLGLAPGIGAISRGFNVAGDVVAGADKVVDVTRATGLAGISDTAGAAMVGGTKAFADEATNLSRNASTLFQRFGDATMGPFTQGADEVAKATQASVDVSLQVPSAASLVDGSQSTEDAKDAAGYGSVAVNAAKADNVHQWIGDVTRAIR